eukprot:NODE_7226_length_600_cov_27.090909_g7203_i0.p1 GENE.NODE_7226_length_600_cov_27.090909_g7203_i0~~NODE_7226_length_600_cov_27.090909_g7203_i0.p1  ORF type:complete len:183 (+),score=46.87 NODE_7226_length_600_cov_27.090909_g7203_i0:40-549(+)
MELVLLCVSNPTRATDLTLSLLDSPLVDFTDAELVESTLPSVQEFFSSLVTNEDTTDRDSILIDRLLSHPTLHMDLMAEDGYDVPLVAQVVQLGSVCTLDLIAQHRKVDWNKVWPDGCTLLQRAVLMDRVEVAQWLLADGRASADVKTENGTARDVARLKQNPAMLALF